MMMVRRRHLPMMGSEIMRGKMVMESKKVRGVRIRKRKRTRKRIRKRNSDWQVFFINIY